MYKSVKDQIREVLITYNLTQKQFAEICGVSQGTISAILRGAEPSCKTIYMLTEFFKRQGV